MNIDEKVKWVVARHKQFENRIERMLAVCESVDSFPIGLEFNGDELSGFDESLEELVVELTGGSMAESTWVPPVKYGTDGMLDHNFMARGGTAWLEAFLRGLLNSRRYFETFIAQEENSREPRSLPETIVINGGTFIASPIGSPNAVADSYVERLEISESSSDAERLLKESLCELRTEIDNVVELRAFERASTISDLENMTGELSKPVNEREEGAIEHYLDRIGNITTKSSKIASALAKIAGILGIG